MTTTAPTRTAPVKMIRSRPARPAGSGRPNVVGGVLSGVWFVIEADASETARAIPKSITLTSPEGPARRKRNSSSLSSLLPKRILVVSMKEKMSLCFSNSERQMFS